MIFTGIDFVLLISAPRLAFNENFRHPIVDWVAVGPLTTTIRDIPSEVLLTPDEDDGPEICVVNTDNIQTIQKENSESFIVQLSPVRMREILDAIRFSLGFDSFE